MDLYNEIIKQGIAYDKMIKLINSKEGTREERDEFFKDIANRVKDFNILISTSCLTIGVDIDNDHFKAAIGVYSHNTASAQQFI
jgi:hypothetical protein